MTVHDYKKELDLLYGKWKQDRWYEALNLLFDISAELSNRGHQYPFMYWEYSEPLSADYREPESYWYDMLIEESSVTLIKLGDFIHRYLKFIRHYGADV